MARIVLKGGPTPGPQATHGEPPPYIDSQTGRGTHRYTRTAEVDHLGRIVYTTGELVFEWEPE